jgi:hypothetical protein
LKRLVAIVLLAAGCAGVWSSSVPAQPGLKPPRIYGYFQARLSSDKQIESQDETTTFTIQQLNVFFQQNLSARWSSFVNVQAVNSYDSQRGWGSMSIEEAWVRYHRSRRLNVKLGLLIPPFNRFNEIKNKMPLHEYIIRPLVYESSLAEVVAVDEFIPRQAYIDVYGSERAGRVSFEYSVYVGNSRHINGSRGPESESSTGVDTSGVFMGGARIGVRHKETTFGVSFTGEPVDLNILPGAADTLGVPADEIDSINFGRIGVDFYTRVWRLDLEAEYITIDYDEDLEDVDLDKTFWYATLGYHFNEKWYAYVSTWKTEEALWHPARGGIHRDFRISGFGGRYALSDRLVFKAQFGKGEYEFEEFDTSEFDFEHTSLAVSVFF